VAPPHKGNATDALAARVGGLRASAITCLEPGAITPANFHTAQDVPGAIDPQALDRAEGFTLDLIRAIDRDLARSRERTPEAQTEDPAEEPSRRIGRLRRRV
jgi:hypothetical protein